MYSAKKGDHIVDFDSGAGEGYDEDPGRRGGGQTKLSWNLLPSVRVVQMQIKQELCIL